MNSAIRRTKIVCTLGPSSQSETQIAKLVQHGMNVARLNFSHGSHAEKKEVVESIRRVADAYNVTLPILADLQGPKIRVGTMKDGSQYIEKDEIVKLASGNSIKGTSEIIPIDYPYLHKDAVKGDKILIDDGLLELKVVAKKNNEIEARVIVGGEVKSRKGVNLPGVDISMASLTPKDIEDLEYAVSLEVDYVAMSFVRTASDVEEVISRLRAFGSQAGVIAKIEKPEAVENIDDIIEESDGVMVARGDLGIEIPSEQVPLIQKRIINRSRKAGKPVITATQMLESMINNPRATRAENSDVANAVLDGTDAVMLSGESAVGDYPAAAVQAMDRICRSVEANATQLYNSLEFRKPEWKKNQIPESMSNAAVSLARNVDAKIIGTLTQSGTTARRIAKFRPHVPVIAFTESFKVSNQLALVWGVTPVVIEAHSDTDRSIRLMENQLEKLGLVQHDDRVILTSGMPVAKRGRTNMVKVSTINETDT
ncbi:MAG TPA: pyruvate kinase [Balneolaceae bacterium]|nr:pyruvate kinase [Balneolaceae bacterium]